MAGNRDEWIFQTVEDCENYINEVGFLPLFASEEFPGGSVQERTKPWVWWTGNEKSDQIIDDAPDPCMRTRRHRKDAQKTGRSPCRRRDLHGHHECAAESRAQARCDKGPAHGKRDPVDQRLADAEDAGRKRSAYDL